MFKLDVSIDCNIIIFILCAAMLPLFTSNFDPLLICSVHFILLSCWPIDYRQ